MIYTVKSNSEGLFKDKGSKFISYLFPISAEDEVKSHLEELKAGHSKARHFCYAFRLGGKGELERANDAGEPNGSAGLPILNQLHSAELTNVLLVVVRYFGGTKLGMSGLIHAYKEASINAIENVRKIKYVEMYVHSIRFKMKDIGKVEQLINANHIAVESKEFGEVCEFKLSCPLGDADQLKGLIQSKPYIK